MTETTAKEVRDAFSACLKRGGAERKGTAWYVRSPEVITITSLQKSEYGPSFYCNLGFWLTGVDGGREKYPTPVGAHVRARAQSLVDGDGEYIDALLDAESPLELDERVLGLRHLIEDQILPFCAGVATAEALRALTTTGRLSHLPVWSAEARELLERP